MSRIQRETIANLAIVGFCLLMYVWAIPTYTPEWPGYGASPALVAYVAVSVMLAMAFLSLIRLMLAQFANKPLPADAQTGVEHFGAFRALQLMGELHVVFNTMDVQPGQQGRETG